MPKQLKPPRISLWRYGQLVGTYPSLEKAQEAANQERRRYNRIDLPGTPFSRALIWQQYGDEWQSNHSGFRITYEQ